MDKIFNTILGTYRYGRLKYDLRKRYDNIGFVHRHLESIGVHKKKIRRVIKLMLKYPKLLTMNPFALMCFILEYFI